MCVCVCVYVCVCVFGYAYASVYDNGWVRVSVYFATIYTYVRPMYMYVYAYGIVGLNGCVRVSMCMCMCVCVRFNLPYMSIAVCHNTDFGTADTYPFTYVY